MIEDVQTGEDFSGEKSRQNLRKHAQSDAIARTKEFFSPDTPLRDAENHGGRPYERRVQQEKMALSVAESLENGRNLCIEAPTGVGKSFAYLVPAIYHAMAMHMPLVITTETINLQEQLANKDLPVLKSLMNLNFSYVIAKGRGNYLCRRRLSMAMGARSEDFLPGLESVKDLEKINEWTFEEHDGSRSSLKFRPDPQLWSCIASEMAGCQGKKCSFYNTCYYWRARHQWDAADIIITNHALFFTNLKIREMEKQENCPLPKYCAVVFDEAHTLEDNAATHLGIHVNSGAFRSFLNRLYNPISGRGLLVKPGEKLMSLRAALSRVHDASQTFFSQFKDDLVRTDDNCFRVNDASRYSDGITPLLSELEGGIHEYAEDCEDDKSFKTELTGQLDKCSAYRDEIEAFIGMSEPQSVYWTEGHNSLASRSQEMSVELISAPLNVAEILRELLFMRPEPVILTSATLAVNDSLDYFVGRTGFCRGEGVILDSPFDYKNQVRLFLSRKMPQPSERTYTSAACDKILDFVKLTRGRAFVLFTSYGMLKECARNLEPYFRGEGINLLVHGETLSRSAMLDEFRRGGEAVIFGATSFWTGVDVPGEALENVIITKLPFLVPSHPLVAARCEKIKASGGEPFRDLSIPDAVLKFRQGIGRLIRSKTDKGIIVVLDPRIVSKYYGRIFLESIPLCPIEYF